MVELLIDNSSISYVNFFQFQWVDWVSTVLGIILNENEKDFEIEYKVIVQLSGRPAQN